MSQGSVFGRPVNRNPHWATCPRSFSMPDNQWMISRRFLSWFTGLCARTGSSIRIVSEMRLVADWASLTICRLSPLISIESGVEISIFKKTLLYAILQFNSYNNFDQHLGLEACKQVLVTQKIESQVPLGWLHLSRWLDLWAFCPATVDSSGSAGNQSRSHVAGGSIIRIREADVVDPRHICWCLFSGKRFAEAFSVPPHLVAGGLFPSVCLKNAELLLNFGETPFAFPPSDGFVAIDSAGDASAVKSSITGKTLLSCRW